MLRISTNGKDFDGKDVAETFIVSIVDNEGNIIEVMKQTTIGADKIEFNIELGENESLRLERSGNSTAVSTQYYSPKKTRPDRMDKPITDDNDFPSTSEVNELYEEIEARESGKGGKNGL